jgi:hypothetical protein
MFSAATRSVPEKMKREVYQEYGITTHGPGDYEVDHLILLELGGALARSHSDRQKDRWSIPRYAWRARARGGGQSDDRLEKRGSKARLEGLHKKVAIRYA